MARQASEEVGWGRGVGCAVVDAVGAARQPIRLASVALVGSEARALASARRVMVRAAALRAALSRRCRDVSRVSTGGCAHRRVPSSAMSRAGGAQLAEAGPGCMGSRLGDAAGREVQGSTARTMLT